MPLTSIVKQGMLDTAKTYFDKVYLMNDATGAINTGDLIGSHVAKIRGGNKDLTWGSASSTQVATTNNTTTNPLVTTHVAGTTFHRLILTDNNATENNRVVHGIIAIPSGQLPGFSADGAYYNRGIVITLTEV